MGVHSRYLWQCLAINDWIFLVLSLQNTYVLWWLFVDDPGWEVNDIRPIQRRWGHGDQCNVSIFWLACDTLVCDIWCWYERWVIYIEGICIRWFYKQNWNWYQAQQRVWDFCEYWSIGCASIHPFLPYFCCCNDHKVVASNLKLSWSFGHFQYIFNKFTIRAFVFKIFNDACCHHCLLDWNKVLANYGPPY